MPDDSDTVENATGEISLARNPTPEKEEKALTHKDRHNALLLTQFQQDIRERRKYAIIAYKLTENWVCFLITITFAQLVARCFGMGLHSEEFIAVVTTTTASVFGFWWLVGRYLFKGPDKEKSKKE